MAAVLLFAVAQAQVLAQADLPGKLVAEVAGGQGAPDDLRAQRVRGDAAVAQPHHQNAAVGGQHLPDAVGGRVDLFLRVEQAVPQRRGLDGDVFSAGLVQLLGGLQRVDLDAGDLHRAVLAGVDAQSARQLAGL